MVARVGLPTPAFAGTGRHKGVPYDGPAMCGVSGHSRRICRTPGVALPRPLLALLLCWRHEDGVTRPEGLKAARRTFNLPTNVDEPKSSVGPPGTQFPTPSPAKRQTDRHRATARVRPGLRPSAPPIPRHRKRSPPPSRRSLRSRPSMRQQRWPWTRGASRPTGNCWSRSGPCAIEWPCCGVGGSRRICRTPESPAPSRPRA